jgi:hypothetical protein
MANCRPFGNCLPECIPVAKEVRQHPCLQGDIGHLTKLYYRRYMDLYDYNDAALFLAALDSCKTEVDMLISPRQCDGGNVSSAGVRTLPVAMYMLIAAFMCIP